MTLGFSPCPNDTFIFDALVNHKIDTEGLDFEVVLEDVQTLNEWALQGKLDISKISYGVLPLVLEQYVVLNSGGALGVGVGPLLIAKKAIDMANIDQLTVAIPGINTTAHILFSQAFPKAQNKSFRVFHEIEQLVLDETVDLGVIIHENRFTYQQKGLHKLMDLGEYWERQTKVPIPLGGIVVKRNMETALAEKIDTLIRKSIDYAFAHYPHLSDYIKQHAQEMSEKVMRQHIDLYVNNYSLYLGTDGKQAVQTLLDVYTRMNNTVTPANKAVFIS
ncbi:1,4-dihydroxy-6-naphthoate synthase [Asinibacterium sp. OR53]|uniref:1,4-dihydroxy-6-naphthoate synthase n=1 Tax=Asinibacterium sp. OR53 TaxID=925409 RepID=UPI00047A6051|nr:1,4-dihydroxy-6-naphthoate synthase [Asinibacterium sp. OR53]